MVRSFIGVLVCALVACGDAPEVPGTAQNGNAPCSVDSDCGAWATPACGAWACTSGVCVLEVVDARTPVGAQTAGDCHYIGCDGGGSLTQWYDGEDIDDDGDPCTDDYCDAYAPKHVPWPEGSACGTFDLVGPWGSTTLPKTCSAAGVCVPACEDGVQNQTETDIDCGGVFPCSPCANGMTCTGAQDCASKRCVAGLCMPCFLAADCGSGVCVAGYCQ